MTGKGGSGGGFRIFPELRKVLGCHMPNFRSLGQSLHIDHFCKNQWVGGRGGPYYPFGRKSPDLLSISSLIVEIFQSIRKLSYVRKYFSTLTNICLGPGTAFMIPFIRTWDRVRPLTNIQRWQKIITFKPFIRSGWNFFLSTKCGLSLQFLIYAWVPYFDSFWPKIEI